jgi:hypothetical protein
MIALASLLVVTYSGFVGAPWWGALMCAMTLIICYAARHIQRSGVPPSDISSAHATLNAAGNCLFIAFAGYWTGAILNLATQVG